jgi:hypothetical protein
MKVLTIVMTFTIVLTAFSGQTTENPIEVGDVQWGRDLEAALRNSANSGKPVLVLFQEVPGCSGVRKFGLEVLTNSSLVAAIENEFYPVLVYNNRKGGMDEQLLKRYSEPAWNYQVIRFLDAEGRDIIPRKDRIWTLSGVASRMIEALTVANRPVPEYLKALTQNQQ